jgi:glycosyltransferase involved in cell wall biosynthesis
LISVVIPAFNEEEAIGSDLDAVLEAMEGTGRDYEVIVVDDGSTDRTAQIARSRGVMVISHPYNKGVGAARTTGIRRARGEVIVMTDADNTYPNADIPLLLEHMDSYDMVVGARKTEEGSLKALRKPAKAAITRLAAYVTRSRIPDLNSGFRCFSRQLALKYVNLLPEGHSWVSTLTLSFLSHGYNVKYIPIDYFPRTGESSFHPILDTRNTLLLIFRTVMYFNPLRIFFPVGFLLFLAGFIRTVYDAKVLHHVKESDVIIIMTALIILSIGFLADLIVRMRRED